MKTSPFEKLEIFTSKLYIIFFSFVLFINIIFSTSLNASLFKISDLEISEPFELNFNKEKVIEKSINRKILLMGNPGEPESLDPHLVRGAYANIITTIIVTYDKPDTIVLVLILANISFIEKLFFSHFLL